MRKAAFAVTSPASRAIDRPAAHAGRIPELVGRVAQATLTETGTRLELSHDVEVAAYRIVQESLTVIAAYESGLIQPGG
jgi:hypothetical protein